MTARVARQGLDSEPLARVTGGRGHARETASTPRRADPQRLGNHGGPRNAFHPLVPAGTPGHQGQHL